MCSFASFFVIFGVKNSLKSSGIYGFRGRICRTGRAVESTAKTARVYEGEARYSRKPTLTIVTHKD